MSYFDGISSKADTGKENEEMRTPVLVYLNPPMQSKNAELDGTLIAYVHHRCFAMRLTFIILRLYYYKTFILWRKINKY